MAALGSRLSEMRLPLHGQQASQNLLHEQSTPLVELEQVRAQRGQFLRPLTPEGCREPHESLNVWEFSQETLQRRGMHRVAPTLDGCLRDPEEVRKCQFGQGSLVQTVFLSCSFVENEDP